MLIRTHRNGGNTSLKEVADAWKKETHDFALSESDLDTQAVALVKRLKASEQKAGPAVPNPLNIH
jgi:hypothetical protein